MFTAIRLGLPLIVTRLMLLHKSEILIIIKLSEKKKKKKKKGSDLIPGIRIWHGLRSLPYSSCSGYCHVVAFSTFVCGLAVVNSCPLTEKILHLVFAIAVEQHWEAETGGADCFHCFVRKSNS